jgi:two-component system, NarL family, response regulator
LHKNKPIRILIAEDHIIARAGMTTIIQAQCDMIVVAEAVNGKQAVDLYRKHQPDIALLDMRMPTMTGYEAAAAIVSEFPQAHIIALSTFGGDEDIRRPLRAGVLAFLTKDMHQDELIGAIRSVHGGQQYFPASVIATLAEQGAQPELSPREIEVLRLLVQGLRNKQISFELGIADDTTKNHVKSLLRKLGTHDRTRATTKAIQRGFIQLDHK